MGSKESNTYRFAVGTPENIQSWVWRMWVQRNEVYIGARDVLNVFKVSLHKSGIWRIAENDNLERKNIDIDRAIVKWRKPIEFAKGWTTSIGIIVTSVQPMIAFRKEKVEDKRIHWYEFPKKGKKLLFKVLFSKSGYSEDDLKKVSLDCDRLATRIVKRNGEVVWLVVREDEMVPFEENTAKEVMQKTKINLKPGSDENSIYDSRVLKIQPYAEHNASTQPTIFDIPLGKENLVIP